MSRAGLAHLGEMVFIPRSYEIFYLTSTKEFVMSLEKGFSITSQQIFVGLQDMSWRRLQHVFSVTIFRLENVLKTSRKTSWRHLGRRKIVMLKTSWKQTNLNVHIFDLVNLHLTNLLPDKSNANPKCID